MSSDVFIVFRFHKTLFIACWIFISLQIIPQIIVGIIAIFDMLQDGQLIPWEIANCYWRKVIAKYLKLAPFFYECVSELTDKMEDLATFKLKDLIKAILWLIMCIIFIAILLVLVSLFGTAFTMSVNIHYCTVYNLVVCNYPFMDHNGVHNIYFSSNHKIIIH